MQSDRRLPSLSSRMHDPQMTSVDGLSSRINSGTRIKKQFVKTKMCPFFLKGYCINGEECSYAHDAAELRPLPDLRKTKLCGYAKRHAPCPNPSCPYAHTVSELKPSTDLVTFKTSLCFFWKKGKCFNGDKCRFAHDLGELRSKSSSTNVTGGSFPDHCINAPEFIPGVARGLTQHADTSEYKEGGSFDRCEDDDGLTGLLAANSGGLTPPTGPAMATANYQHSDHDLMSDDISPCSARRGFARTLDTTPVAAEEASLPEISSLMEMLLSNDAAENPHNVLKEAAEAALIASLSLDGVPDLATLRFDDSLFQQVLNLPKSASMASSSSSSSSAACHDNGFGAFSGSRLPLPDGTGNNQSVLSKSLVFPKTMEAFDCLGPDLLSRKAASSLTMIPVINAAQMAEDTQPSPFEKLAGLHAPRACASARASASVDSLGAVCSQGSNSTTADPEIVGDGEAPMGNVTDDYDEEDPKVGNATYEPFVSSLSEMLWPPLSLSPSPESCRRCPPPTSCPTEEENGDVQAAEELLRCVADFAGQEASDVALCGGEANEETEQQMHDRGVEEAVDSVVSPHSDGDYAALTSSDSVEEGKKAATGTVPPCRICGVAKVSVAFVPCGHTKWCEECGAKMTRCSVCDEEIKFRIRVRL